MARISLTPPHTLVNRIVAAYSRRVYGRALQPMLAIGHNRKVLLTWARLEKSVARWDALDRTLKDLAVMAAAHRIGCSWCTDFGYWHSYAAGVDPAKLDDVPRWRDSDRFTDTERMVMQYAEQMSADTSEVTDELVAALRTAIGEPALVELTMIVAVENQRSRFNAALGLTAQGFKDTCELPA